MFAAYLPLLLSALAFVVVIFSFLYLKSYIKARTSQERFLSGLREEVNSILKSINETTDRDISLIEEREKNLKALLGEVEKRLKVYIREVEVRREAENTYRELGKKRYRFLQNLRDEPEPPGESEALDEAAAQPGDSGEVTPQTNPSPAFPIPEFQVKPQAPQGEPPKDELNFVKQPSIGEQIHSLVRAGFSIPLIASRLGISIAEVEFAAALLERRVD